MQGVLENFVEIGEKAGNRILPNRKKKSHAPAWLFCVIFHFNFFCKAWFFTVKNEIYASTVKVLKAAWLVQRMHEYPNPSRIFQAR